MEIDKDFTKKGKRTFYKDLLSISASIASLAGFMMMIMEKADVVINWVTIISYIVFSMFIIGLSTMWVCIGYWAFQAAKNRIYYLALVMLLWGSLIIIEIFSILVARFIGMDLIPFLMLGHS